MVDWLNVDTCFGAKKWACSSSYPLFLCAKPHGLVCSVFVALKESGQYVVLKTVKDIVFKVFRLCKPPMWQIMLLVSKSGFSWKGEVGWDRVACMS